MELSDSAPGPGLRFTIEECPQPLSQPFKWSTTIRTGFGYSAPLKDKIWPSVRDAAIAIVHVGSTAVHGMAGKPTIDVDIVIASQTDLPLLRLRLRTLGYKHRGNLGIEGREAFLAPQGQPAHHLYVYVQNSLAFQNHIAVRDYLRTHPSKAVAYSTLKKRLAERFPKHRERYVEGKTDFLLTILEQCGFSAKELNSIRGANQS